MKKKMFTKSQSPVDALAEVLARKAELEKEEKELKARLIESGNSTVEGKLFKANVMLMPGRETLDVKALLAFLKVGADVAKRFTNVGNPFYTVRVVSR